MFTLGTAGQTVTQLASDYLMNDAIDVTQSVFGSVYPSVTNSTYLNGDAVVQLAPFLPRETLRGLVAERLEQLRQPHIIAELAPFVGQATLEALIRGASGGSPAGNGARETMDLASTPAES